MFMYKESIDYKKTIYKLHNKIGGINSVYVINQKFGLLLTKFYKYIND